MAAIDLSRIPGKKGDLYRGQAVHKLPPHSEEHKIKIPAIPDFRFESAYLSAIRPFVNQLDSQASRPPESKKEEIAGEGGQVSEVRFDYGVPIRINWPAVLWITLRDQACLHII
ncbi:SubName: Full=Uncharacterized protein {ECO:0000313/EMBL:CCA74455.1} [Serendipita indica DSM 11827]|nr:SubName: Full=Uncharacterized protein {ECO:0000313/EMBL:CCA74455.1} [Serendipita indica DSM 11827]